MPVYSFDTKFQKVQREGMNYFSFKLLGGEPIKYSTMFQYNHAYNKYNYPTVMVYNEQIKEDKKEEIATFLKDWIDQCKSCFVKQPLLEECIQNSFHEDHIMCVNPEEYNTESLYKCNWELRTVCIGTNKKLFLKWDLVSCETRPPIIEFQDSTPPEMQEPEKIFTLSNPALYQNQGPEELTDIPLSDISPFRLDANFEKQREKYRKRIRDARIKAKLARYRAERLCAIYEEKFGYWPSEDEDEAQTEVDSDNSY